MLVKQWQSRRGLGMLVAVADLGVIWGVYVQ